MTRPGVINIVKEVTKEGGRSKIKLDEEALKTIFMNPDVVDIPVALYAIAGPFRSGKSFLLNLFIRYIQRKMTPTCDLELDPEEVLEGCFEWRGGVDRHTEGIFVSRQPYIIPTTKHPKVAVFLMDTQGMFDHTSSTGDSALIVALSFLISSFQIFNLKHQIDGNHLQYLCKFVEFAQKIREHGKHISPFQTLMFLIRDWENPQFSCGLQGGKQYIEYTLQTRGSQAQEHHFVRNKIRDTFDKISCFLLPQPGLKVKFLKEQTETCRIQDIEKEFMKNAEKLFETLCPEDEIVLKKINGEFVNGRQLFHYATEYAKILDSDVVESVDSFLQAGMKAEMNNVISQCLDEYRSTMLKLSCMQWKASDFEKLRIDHESTMKKSLKLFDVKQKPGNDEMQREARQKLQNSISQCYDELKEEIHIKVVYTDVINEYTNSLNSGMALKSKENLEQQDKESTKLIIEKLREKIPKSLYLKYCKHFRKDSKKILEGIRKLNNRNRVIVGSVAGVVGGAGLVALSFAFPPLLCAAIAAEVATEAIITSAIAGGAVAGGFVGAGSTSVVLNLEDDGEDGVARSLNNGLITPGIMAARILLPNEALQSSEDCLIVPISCGAMKIPLEPEQN